jgi:transposase
MGTRYREYNPEQPFLLPPSPRDWLPDNHLAYFISDTLDQLDLRLLHRRYEGDGRRNQPYHPEMMLKLLVYAYATGVFSSRQIARKIDEDVALRVLAAGNRPDFRTINSFRSEQLEIFKKLFVEVVQLARRTGLLKLGTVALDGTKLKANASKHKAMSYERMQQQEARLEQEILELIDRAEQIDAAEDEIYGPDATGDEVPEQLRRRESRIAKIREAKAALEAEQAAADRAQGRRPDDDRVAGGERPQGGQSKYKREFGVPQPKAQRNFTDPESRIMKTGQGFEQCYNAQAVVEQGAQLIVATTVGANAADNGYLSKLLDEIKNNTGRKPRRVLADAGYKGEQNFEEIERRKIQGYVALGRETNKGGETQTKAGGEATARMRKRLLDPRGRARYRKRKALVEPAFGWVKRVLGFREFSMRGLEKAQGEWNLVTAALNLRRMARMEPPPQAA